METKSEPDEMIRSSPYNYNIYIISGCVATLNQRLVYYM